MLNLIFGSFTSDTGAFLGERILARVEEHRPALLIVPEQQTVATESVMCDILPAYAPLYFEVTNFTRLVNTVFRALGGLTGEYSTGEDEALTMWRALNDYNGTLKDEKKTKKINGAQIKRVLGAVKEMEKLGITPEDLSCVTEAAVANDRRLGDKTRELSVTYALYKALFDEKYSGVDTSLVAMSKKLQENPTYISGNEIYVEGFTSFTEGQYALLRVLIRLCPVHICLTLPEGERDSFEFTEINKTRKRLLSLADTVSADKSIERIPTSFAPTPQLYENMSRLLWKTKGTLDNNCLHFLQEDRERVRIFEAKTPFEECDFIAEDIKKNLLLGDKYSDFAIIARSADDYVGILDVSLSKRKIPHFISKRKDISSLEAIKLINSAYRIICGGFKREDVLTYLKSGLGGISADARDEFEIYIKKWDIDKSRFYDGDTWYMNPRGYTRRTQADIEKLEAIEETRERLITPLMSFKADVEKASSVTEQARALISFLTSLDLEKALLERAKLFDSLGENGPAEENARLWELICAALDKVVDILGDIYADGETFCEMLSVVFAEKSIGRIPTGRDEVTVGSADMLRTSKKKHVYLIGVNEGEFPACARESSYFSKRDKAVLCSLGLNIDPDYSEGEARELYCFTRAFTSSCDRLTLIYSVSSASLSPLRPSEVISRIGEITDKTVEPQLINGLSPSERIFSEEDALTLLGRLGKTDSLTVEELLAGKDGERILKISEKDTQNEDSVLSEEAIAILYSGDVYMSQSRLESYLSCPFRYFLESNLKLSKTDKAEFTSATIGTFVHSVLEKFFLDLRRKNLDTKNMTDEDKLSIIDRAAKEYVEATLGDNYNKERTKSAVSRLSKAAKPIVDELCEELENSSFVPTFFELSTAGRRPADASPAIFTAQDGGRVIVKGIVDRVDTFKNGEDVYVRVIDYKTGKKNFSPTDMKEGENLQMFLYLKSIVESGTEEFRRSIGVSDGGRLIPAGVIYVGASVKDTTVDRASDEDAVATVKGSIKRDGMVLDNSDSLDAMNIRYVPTVEDKRRGTTVPDPSRLYTPDEWDEICGDMEKAILDIVSDMKRGCVHASPKELKSRTGNPCSFCDYKSVCRAPKE